jgi:hypothetical protein
VGGGEVDLWYETRPDAVPTNKRRAGEQQMADHEALIGAGDASSG